MKSELTPRQQEVLRFIQLNDGCLRGDILTNLKIHPTTLSVILIKLKSHRHILCNPSEPVTRRATPQKHYAIDTQVLVG